MKKQTSPPNRRGRLVLLCFVLGLILIVMLVGTVYLQHLLGRIHYVDSGTAPTLSPEELDAYLATQPEEISTAPTMDPEDVTFPDYDADIGRDSDIINILLIGQDRREDETRARSDSMILCTFHKSEKKLTMTSFLRDTYVKIPGYGQNRINVAYAAGGMPLGLQLGAGAGRWGEAVSRASRPAVAGGGAGLSRGAPRGGGEEAERRFAVGRAGV